MFFFEYDIVVFVICGYNINYWEIMEGVEMVLKFYYFE